MPTYVSLPPEGFIFSQIRRLCEVFISWLSSRVILPCVQTAFTNFLISLLELSSELISISSFFEHGLSDSDRFEPCSLPHIDDKKFLSSSDTSSVYCEHTSIFLNVLTPSH